MTRSQFQLSKQSAEAFARRFFATDTEGVLGDVDEDDMQDFEKLFKDAEAEMTVSRHTFS